MSTLPPPVSRIVPVNSSRGGSCPPGLGVADRGVAANVTRDPSTAPSMKVTPDFRRGRSDELRPARSSSRIVRASSIGRGEWTTTSREARTTSSQVDTLGSG